MEINERAAAVAREKGFAVHTLPLAQFTPREGYEMVVLSNVLEHTPDLVAMLRQVSGLLRPRG